MLRDELSPRLHKDDSNPNQQRVLFQKEFGDTFAGFTVQCSSYTNFGLRLSISDFTCSSKRYSCLVGFHDWV